MEKPQRDFRTELAARFPSWNVTGPYAQALEEIPMTQIFAVDQLCTALRWRLCECLTIIDGMTQDERYKLDTDLYTQDVDLAVWLKRVSRLRRNNYFAIQLFLMGLATELHAIEGKSEAKKAGLAGAIEHSLRHVESVAPRDYREHDIPQLLEIADTLDASLLKVHGLLGAFLRSTPEDDE